MSFADNAKLDLLIARAVPEEARINGGNQYTASLRKLWDMAYSIGVNHGEKNLADVRYDGYQDGCLAMRQEADIALNTAVEQAERRGFREGVSQFDELKLAMEEALTCLGTMQQTVECERVWGFDVGWALGRERERQLTEARLLPSLPSLVSTASAATQTNPLPFPSPFFVLPPRR
ncbi:hypothetical protein FB45DRAFT_61192 [Roridomyces roridus]|uniref:Uncharacterized protein n=1 Tax=Roridomyces roridus TaxID=1738132 RepID=A0AAD7BQE1_9AGAR|nr:hypothetical protein FB45DRAFT_61192 [Roridomyces roridus]